MDAPEEISSPAAMKELIQYFEKHGQRLDRQDPNDGATSLSGAGDPGFVSCIRFNGIPILPPVMTSGRREESRHERHRAVFEEKRMQARQRKHLMAVANAMSENADVQESVASASEIIVRPPAGKPTGASLASRLVLERPPVLKPVVTTAWASLTASSTTVGSGQSVDSVGALGASSLANTFATAEQAEPAQEDFGLQTLDSVCSEFLSMEETLPTDFNGVPLTSFKQQKISYDLTRLSRVLGVKDFNSTGGSDASELPSESVGGSETLERTGATSALDNVSASFCHESQDTVVEVGGDPDTSTDASPAELSGSGNTSGMSSANTTGDSHRSSTRSSPRSFKSNTVHFASFVTEYIDTSASLSSENITVVKKKMPKDGSSKEGKEPGSTNSSASHSGEDRNLLANVSLVDSMDTPLTPSPPTSVQPNLPFQSYAKTSDPSSSDKENDSKQANKMSKSASTSGGRPSQKGGDLQPAVTDSQGSSRSTATSESSNSTLIEDAAAGAVSRESSHSLPPNIVGEETVPAKDSGVKNPGNPPAVRKPKKLPAEPVEASQGGRPARPQLKSQEAAAADAQSHSRTAPGYKKGHVRKGSYTLSSPSPALVRAQGVTGAGASGVEEGEAHGRYDDNEDHTKPLNVSSLQPVVPSDPESMGKAEHISKYLSQVQLHSSDVTASQATSADLSQFQQAAAAQLQQSFSILQSLNSSRGSVGSAGSAEEVLSKFQTMRQTMLEQQQRELEELFVQQRREQMLLQAEFEEHQERMNEQDDFLIANAPENIKVKSHQNDGELSPDDNETGVKRFNFPAPHQSQAVLQGQRSGSAGMGMQNHDGGPLLLNTSASSNSPKVRRPVLRSPVKFFPGRRYSGRVVVPPEAYEPEMRVKFEKLSAVAKGFLCRRLIHTDKVQELVKTIKDTREFAFSFQSETPIRKGNFSNQDRTLLERIVAQLQAALLDIHEIFFDTSIQEQMALIEQTRLNYKEKMMKSSTDESVRSSAPRISLATLKAQERRRRAQEAESVVFGAASSARSRTAHSSSGSPRAQSSVDLSGPLKRHYQSLLIKALKPSAMAAHHNQLVAQSHQGSPLSTRPDSARAEKNRPQTAPEKSSSRPKKPVSTSGTSTSTSTHTTDNGQPKLNIRPKQLPHQQSQHQQHSSSHGSMPNVSSKTSASSSSSSSNKPIKTSTKSWR